MKKIIYSISLLTVALSLAIGCNKDKDEDPSPANNNNNNTVDSIPPIITLTGPNPFYLVLNSTFYDPGAGANDLVDGNIICVVSGTLNKDHVGDYTLTYTATDSSGNSRSTTRVVHVYNQAESFDGTYANCMDSCQSGLTFTFTAIVTSSDTVNKDVTINNFGGFGNQINIQAEISGWWDGAPIIIPAGQSLGSSANLVQIFPDSTHVISDGLNTSLRIRYQWTDGVNTEVCESLYLR